MSNLFRQKSKKRRVIEAVRFHKEGDHPAVISGLKMLDIGQTTDKTVPFVRVSVFAIETPEGWQEVRPGDWIITGSAGELHPCNPDIFAAIFEPMP